MDKKQQNTYIAFAGMLHNIGKITERGQVDMPTSAGDDVRLCCPDSNALESFPHKHTEWLIACADRIASGQDTPHSAEISPNHYRLHSPLAPADTPAYAKLTELTPESLFFEDLDNETEVRTQYKTLYSNLKKSLNTIPNKEDFPLWLSHMDSALLAHTYCVPSASPQPDTKPEVSLYDHSKAVAGFAVALHQYHGHMDDTALSDLQCLDENTRPFLIIQGDFVGIQDFIFDSETVTDEHTAKMLRGKSFYVSLLTELASLQVLQQLDLPCTSKIISVAGKFIIIAGNTKENKQKLDHLSQKISQWFIDNFYGVGNIVIAYSQARSIDFFIKKDADNQTDTPFAELMQQLYKDLDMKKHQGHNLHDKTPVFEKEYKKFSKHEGSCRLNDNYPADTTKNGLKLHRVSADYITIGENIVQVKYIIITDKEYAHGETLKQKIFDFYVTFVDKKPIKNTARDGIIRIWDYRLPEDKTTPIFNGTANIYISGYVPTKDPQLNEHLTYEQIEKEVQDLPDKATLSFSTLSQMDLDNKEDSWYGVSALSVVKGDIDNLGALFRNQAKQFTFAGYASLSRQIDMFFTVYLPTWLHTHPEYRYCYTVFAGGDDFMLIGPWYTMHKLAQDLRKEFKRYTQNNKVTFSVGVVLCDAKTPIKTMSEMGEQALEKAKSINDKDAITLFDIPVKWSEYDNLETYKENIFELSKQVDLSTGYVYSTMQFTRMAEDENKDNNAMWLSRHTYRTARYANDKKIPPKDMNIFLTLISTYKIKANIPLSLYLYKNRKYSKNG